MSFFYPNGGDCDKLFDVDTEWDFVKSLLYLDVEDELIKFKRQYKKYIDYYQEKYGSIEVDYGIIRWGC